MPAWIWLLLGLTAIGFVLWLLDAMGRDATERFRKALAILFVLAVLVGLVFSLMYAGWE